MKRNFLSVSRKKVIISFCFSLYANLGEGFLINKIYDILTIFASAILKSRLVKPKSTALDHLGIFYDIYIYIYIYIYILSLRKNNETNHKRIINLFPSCYAFLKFSKTRKKINRTSSDLFFFFFFFFFFI